MLGVYTKKYKILKWAQLILSAVSTGGFIGTLITNQILFTWVGGICSTILLVLTAYFKDTDFSTVHKLHLDTSNKLWLLREQYLLLLIDFSTLSRGEIVIGVVPIASPDEVVVPIKET